MGITTPRTAATVTTLVAALAGSPGGASGQAFFLDATVDQGYASDPLPSPLGFSVAVGRTGIFGPLGLHAGVRTLSEGSSEEVQQYCNFAFCTPGPFEESNTMRLIYVGLSYDFRNRTDVYLDLGLNVGLGQQTRHLDHQGSGEDIELGGTDETTLGGSVDLRLRPLLGPLRPVFSGRYDRVFQSECMADAFCLPARDVWSVSVGLSWVAPAR